MRVSNLPFTARGQVDVVAVEVYREGVEVVGGGGKGVEEGLCVQRERAQQVHDL